MTTAQRREAIRTVLDRLIVVETEVSGWSVGLDLDGVGPEQGVGIWESDYHSEVIARTIAEICRKSLLNKIMAAMAESEAA